MQEKLKRFIHKAVMLLILCIILSIAFVGYSFIKWNQDKQEIFYKIKNLRNSIQSEQFQYMVPRTITIYDRYNQVIATISDRDYSYIRLSEIPPYVVDLLLMKEDTQFFTHHGVNVVRIAKSLFINIIRGRNAFGGSTITQQVGKLLFTDQKKTVKRKIYEAFSAFYIEKLLSKKDILEIYINIAFFGYGRFGVERASQFYFNKSVREISFPEALMMISIISAPERFSPLKNEDIARRKYLALLKRAIKLKYIVKTAGSGITDSFFDSYDFNALKNPGFILTKDKAPWVTAYVLQFLDKDYSLETAFNKNYSVYTTIDLNSQIALQDSVSDYIGGYIPVTLQNMQLKEPVSVDDLEIASVSIIPSTGEIISFVGGKRYSVINQFNRAFKARRQIGSIFKPILYLYAFHKGLVSPYTTIEDKPLVIQLDKGKWQPKNYGNKYHGNVQIWKAIQMSLNSVMIQVTQQMDLNDFVKWLNDISPFIDKETKNFIKPYQALGLGIYEMTPIDVASIYQTIAFHGVAISASVIKKIVSADEIIIENISERATTPIDSSITDELIYLLRYTSADGGTSYNARIKNDFNFPVYSKTGTTDNGRDSWFIGFSPGLVTVTWTGIETGKGQNILTGGSFSAFLYYNYVKKVSPFYSGDFEFTNNGSIVSICEITGKKAKSQCPPVLLFLTEKNIPLEGCDVHGENQSSAESSNTENTVTQ